MELKLRAFSRYDENGRPEEDMVTEVWTGFTDRNGVEVYEGGHPEGPGDDRDGIIRGCAYGAGAVCGGVFCLRGLRFRLDDPPPVVSERTA